MPLNWETRVRTSSRSGVGIESKGVSQSGGMHGCVICRRRAPLRSRPVLTREASLVSIKVRKWEYTLRARCKSLPGRSCRIVRSSSFGSSKSEEGSSMARSGVTGVDMSQSSRPHTFVQVSPVCCLHQAGQIACHVLSDVNQDFLKVALRTLLSHV